MLSTENFLNYVRQPYFIRHGLLTDRGCPGEEVRYSTSRRWQTLGFHPESNKMYKLRQSWLKEHPNIRETSGPTADISSDSEDEDELGEQSATEAKE